MKHSKYEEVKTLVSHNINVLLTGTAGSGKTTILKTIAEDLGLDFHAVSMTRQTTLNALLGFISINGTYIPSTFRQAVEHGGMMLFDEIDAADPNTILSLNTIENGFVAFPDKAVQVHPDFRWVATANPQNAHHIYTGRSKLDAATLDRFDIVEIPLDEDLERTLTCVDTHAEIKIMRTILEENNSSTSLSMRDSIRYFKRKQIGLADNYHISLLQNEDYLSAYYNKLAILRPPKPKQQSECATIDELWDTILKEKTSNIPEEYEVKEITKDFLKYDKFRLKEHHDNFTIDTGITADNLFGDTVRVHYKPTNTIYKFTREELQ